MVALQSPLQDPEAFSKLFDRTQTIIFRFIYGISGGPIEDVEDLTCDTFLRAWKGRTQFSGDEHDALCWLFTIARRLVIDSIRRRKNHPVDSQVSLDENTIEMLVPANQTSPEDALTNREQFERLWYHLQNLQEDRREMLVLRYMVGWKVKEIANYLEMEENTVSVYIRRGLDQIRQEWSQGQPRDDFSR